MCSNWTYLKFQLNSILSYLATLSAKANAKRMRELKSAERPRQLVALATVWVSESVCVSMCVTCVSVREHRVRERERESF